MQEISKIAVVFPGQGSQRVGMLGEFAKNHPQVTKVFTTASDILGYDLWKVVQKGPEEKLSKTEYTQPAMLAAGYATWQVLYPKFVFDPLFLAGHSLGEYSALTCANALQFTDAIRLVKKRAQLMQKAVPLGQGGMLVLLGLDKSQALEVCAKAAEDKIIAPANYNAIGQIVLAGNIEAVRRAADIAKTMGAKKAQLLEVSVPSHCRLMEPAVAELTAELAKITINKPTIPVVNNVDVTCYATDTEIKDALIRQLCNPVRWIETIEFFKKHGVQQIIECGPGKVLAGLNKRIVREISTVNFVDYIA